MRRALLTLAMLVPCVPPAALPALAKPCDGGALVVVDLPDGGPALPGVLCAGQRAPVDLVAMVPRRAAEIAGTCEASQAQAAHLEQAIKQEGSAISAKWIVITSSATLMIGLVIGAVIGSRK